MKVRIRIVPRIFVDEHAIAPRCPSDTDELRGGHDVPRRADSNEEVWTSKAGPLRLIKMLGHLPEEHHVRTTGTAADNAIHLALCGIGPRRCFTAFVDTA